MVVRNRCCTYCKLYSLEDKSRHFEVKANHLPGLEINVKDWENLTPLESRLDCGGILLVTMFSQLNV